MAPQQKEIFFERSSSSMSYLTGTTTSSYSTITPAFSSKLSPVSLASLGSFALSIAVYIAFVFGTENFVPSHDGVYDREHPYQTTKTGDVILNSELNHPMIHPASVPSKLLFRTCVHVPLVFLFLIHFRSSWNCTLASMSGLLSAMGICEVTTHIVKYYVLRRRPNFYAHCGWDNITRQCTEVPKKVLEAQISFPSGHSSLSWCGMTFMVLILLGRMQLSSSQRSWWKQWAVWLACWIPLSWSTYVSTSRIVDRWHHASDVVAGSLLGILCATVSYHSLFPHIFSMDAGFSYAELTIQKNA